MIRATRKLLGSHHHARRLHYTARRSLASSSTRAATVTAAPSIGTASTGENYWSVGSLAAGLSALGVGLAAVQSCEDENSLSAVAKCEEVASDRSASWGMAREDAHGGEAEGRPLFRTIPLSKLNAKELDAGGDGGKSERAFASAVQNSLFNTYEDGADDWEGEMCDDANAAEESTRAVDDANNDAPATSNAAIQEHFVSFSPAIAMSRRAEREYTNDDLGDSLLATSNAAAESLRLHSEAAAAAQADRDKDRGNTDVILKRIKTVRRNELGHNQVYTKKMYFYKSASVKEHMLHKFRLFALPSSENLGKEMAYLLGTDLNCISVGAYNDGETSVKIEEQCRGKNVFVVCTTTSSSAIMELLLAISALRRGSAKRICAVIPYYGYGRQDRRTGMKREPIAAADMARLLEEMGIDSVITVDLHNPLVKGFFSPTIPVDHLMPGPVAAAYFYEELFGIGEDDGDNKDKNEEESKEVPKITVIAAHENQVFRANGFRNALQKLSGSDDIRVALINNTKALNRRDGNRPALATTLVGDVNGRKCIIVDDIINTGGTMRKAIDIVDKAGASEVYAWATHGVLHLPQNDAPQMIQDMDCLKYLLISNSVAIERELPPKIRKLSIAPLLAESVARAIHSESISSMMTVKAHKSEK
mmetsp:Transcript_28335/g.68201  ORF Transcript_28335/g.68201 Transcript_28335/m.68201 type:complete len:648 (-) Transcript_28335:1945-3888(-)